MSPVKLSDEAGRMLAPANPAVISSVRDDGQPVSAADGHVSVQLVRANLQPFDSDDFREATFTEMTTAWPSYFGYFGTYTIDATNAVITHHIESGWFPNLAGTEQTPVGSPTQRDDIGLAFSRRGFRVVAKRAPIPIARVMGCR